MGKSWKRQRRERYFEFPESDFREAVYSLAKSLQAQGVAIPDTLQAFVNHCDAVRRDIPKKRRGSHSPMKGGTAIQ